MPIFYLGVGDYRFSVMLEQKHACCNALLPTESNFCGLLISRVVRNLEVKNPRSLGIEVLQRERGVRSGGKQVKSYVVHMFNATISSKIIIL